MDIMSLVNALPGVAAQGLIWGIMAIGVYITYKILDVADLTVDGTMCTGGATFIMLTMAGANVWDGYTDFRLNEIGIIQTLARVAKQTIAVMDSSKLGKCSKRKALEPDQVDILIMDDQVPQKTREKYAQKGIIIQ